MIPLRIFKWLLVIVGVYCLISGEVEPFGAFVMIAIGVALILFTGKSGNNNSNTTSSQRNATVETAPEKTVTTPIADQSGICPHCHAKCDNGAVYCENCGHKLI